MLGESLPSVQDRAHWTHIAASDRFRWTARAASQPACSVSVLLSLFALPSPCGQLLFSMVAHYKFIGVFPPDDDDESTKKKSIDDPPIRDPNDLTQYMAVLPPGPRKTD